MAFSLTRALFRPKRWPAEPPSWSPLSTQVILMFYDIIRTEGALRLEDQCPMMTIRIPSSLIHSNLQRPERRKMALKELGRPPINY